MNNKNICKHHGEMKLVNCQCCGGNGYKVIDDDDLGFHEYDCRCCDGTGDDYICEICCEQEKDYGDIIDTILKGIK